METKPGTQLEQICRAVDAILEAIESAPLADPGPTVRDVNDAFLCAAYGRVYRCVRSIRELAGRGEADDAIVLLRHLVSIVGASIWLAAPTDPAERPSRFHRARR